MESNIYYTRFVSLIFEKLLEENYISNDLTPIKPHTITSASFQKPLASEVALTSHMLKVAKLFQEPEQSLITPSKEVNADDTADKSLSKTFVHPVTQPKAPTDLKIKKKRIPHSSKPKSPYKVLNIIMEENVEEEEIAKEHSLHDSNKQAKDDEPTLESPFDIKSDIKFIKSFKSPTINISFMSFGPTNITLDNVVSSFKLSSMPDDDLHYVSTFDTIKSDDDEDVDMVDSEHISKEGTADTFLNTFVEFHSFSGHLDHICEEVSNLHSKLTGLLTEALKDSMIINDTAEEEKNKKDKDTNPAATQGKHQSAETIPSSEPLVKSQGEQPADLKVANKKSTPLVSDDKINEGK
ncbi:hypothetical protein Tco_0855797 [Tanacetum coccineum]